MRERPFLAASAIESGLLTKAQLRSSPWRRLFRGVYVSSSLALTHLLWVEGAAFILLPYAAITGRSAALLWRAQMGDIDAPVEVLTPRQFGPIDGLTIRTGPLPDQDTAERWGTRVTSPLRTAWEIARTRPEQEAVEWIDALARCRRLSRAQLAAEADSRSGTNGSRRASRTLAICDPRSESPAESRLRLSLAASGLPMPTPQYVVVVNGFFIARVDFAWPDLKLAIEYDGRWHGGALDDDRKRSRALTAAGWQIFPVTADDMHGVDRLMTELTAAYRKRANGFTGKVR